MNVLLKNGQLMPLNIYIYKQYLTNPDLDLFQYEKDFIYTCFLSTEEMQKNKFTAKDWKKVRNLAIQFKKSLPFQMRLRIINKTKVYLFHEDIAVEWWLKYNDTSAKNWGYPNV